MYKWYTMGYGQYVHKKYKGIMEGMYILFIVIGTVIFFHYKSTLYQR
jgi:hypothetical protein